MEGKKLRTWLAAGLGLSSSLRWGALQPWGKRLLGAVPPLGSPLGSLAMA